MTSELWERIRGDTIEGYLGTQSKVLKDFTRAGRGSWRRARSAWSCR
ncbi:MULTISPECIES: hypothetical protein [unclassified Streptomyces]|nr:MULTISPECIES: hypothetical protein [unclassified Streptomyces]